MDDKNRDGGGKPRGMAAAKARAWEDAQRGAQQWDCPYKAEAWRTVWLRELARAQQIPLFEC